jgi:hypothetical protein
MQHFLSSDDRFSSENPPSREHFWEYIGVVFSEESSLPWLDRPLWSDLDLDREP